MTHLWKLFRLFYNIGRVGAVAVLGLFGRKK